jgi:hypothetical protein
VPQWGTNRSHHAVEGRICGPRRAPPVPRPVPHRSACHATPIHLFLDMATTPPSHVASQPTGPAGVDVAVRVDRAGPGDRRPLHFAVIGREHGGTAFLDLLAPRLTRTSSISGAAEYASDSQLAGCASAFARALRAHLTDPALTSDTRTQTLAWDLPQGALFVTAAAERGGPGGPGGSPGSGRARTGAVHDAGRGAGRRRRRWPGEPLTASSTRSTPTRSSPERSSPTSADCSALTRPRGRRCCAWR